MVISPIEVENSPSETEHLIARVGALFRTPSQESIPDVTSVTLYSGDSPFLAESSSTSSRTAAQTSPSVTGSETARQADCRSLKRNRASESPEDPKVPKKSKKRTFSNDHNAQARHGTRLWNFIKQTTMMACPYAKFLFNSDCHNISYKGNEGLLCHLRDCHVALGDISEQEYRRLARADNFKPFECDNPSEKEVRCWRKRFVAIYPIFAEVEHLLNPYTQAPLLGKSQVYRQRQLRVLEANGFPLPYEYHPNRFELAQKNSTSATATPESRLHRDDSPESMMHNSEDLEVDLHAEPATVLQVQQQVRIIDIVDRNGNVSLPPHCPQSYCHADMGIRTSDFGAHTSTQRQGVELITPEPSQPNQCSEADTTFPQMTWDDLIHESECGDSSLLDQQMTYSEWTADEICHALPTPVPSTFGLDADWPGGEPRAFEATPNFRLETRGPDFEDYGLHMTDEPDEATRALQEKDDEAERERLRRMYELAQNENLHDDFDDID